MRKMECVKRKCRMPARKGFRFCGGGKCLHVADIMERIQEAKQEASLKEEE